MECKIQLRCLNLSDLVEAKRLFYIDFLINQKYHFKTLQHKSIDKRIPICEQIEIDVKQQSQFYVQIQIRQLIASKDTLVDQKVLFSAEQKLQKCQFQIPTKDKIVIATIDCAIYFNNVKINEISQNIFQKMDKFGKQVKQQLHDIKEQMQDLKDQGSSHRLQIIKIGEQAFHTANRMDNILKIKSLFQHYIKWTSPTLTICMTLFLTLFIFSPRVTTVLICTLLLFFRQKVTGMFLTFSNFLEFPENRLVIPQKNTAFMKTGMEQFCGFIDKIKPIFVDPQKTHLKIIISRFIYKLWIPMVSVIFLSFQELAVLLLWILVLGQNQKCAKIMKILKQAVDQNIAKVEKFIFRKSIILGFEMVNNQILNVDQKEQITLKSIFVYEYERQWFGVFNTKDSKIADQSSQILMNKDKFPHPDYEWVDNWKFVVNAETDPDGYTYSADLVHKYHKDRNLLDALRRRKWMRKCRKTQKQNLIKRQEMESNKELKSASLESSLLLGKNSQVKKPISESQKKDQ